MVGPRLPADGIWLIYAAVGSLVARPEELQTIALPLSIVAIIGYLMAALSLTGGTPGFIKVASFVPFWSPFVMLTRLTVGRVEPWELLLSLLPQAAIAIASARTIGRVNACLIAVNVMDERSSSTRERRWSRRSRDRTRPRRSRRPRPTPRSGARCHPTY